MKRKENKGFSYLLNVPMHNGELTVIKNSHAEDAMHHSIRLAREANESGLGVLIINCGMTDRRFRENFNEVCAEREQDPRLILHTATRGNLVGDRDELEPIVARAMIGLVIIVGWEWTSDSYKRSRRLYTFLWDLLDFHKTTVVVYANSNHEIQAGKFDQRGLGKLTLMAVAACEVNSVEKLERVAPKPKPHIVSEGELKFAEQGVAELVRKINRLPREDRPGAHEDDEYAEAA